MTVLSKDYTRGGASVVCDGDNYQPYTREISFNNFSPFNNLLLISLTFANSLKRLFPLAHGGLGGGGVKNIKQPLLNSVEQLTRRDVHYLNVIIN